MYGNRSLLWTGANNLIDQSYRRFVAFKGDTFTVTKLVYLTPADLALFSFRKKVHIKGVNYVVGSMKAVLGHSQNVIPTEVVLWKCWSRKIVPLEIRYFINISRGVE